MVALSRNAGSVQAAGGGGGGRRGRGKTQHSVTVELLKREPIPLGVTKYVHACTHIPT